MLAWHPGGKFLAFLIEKKGILNLHYYFPETNKLERQSVFGVDKIHDMNYSPNGLSILVSATLNGQSDIFLYHLASKTFEQITKDIYDDMTPRFVQNGKYIAFSSNRTSDTLVFDKETNIKDYSKTPVKSEHFNIFLCNYNTKSPVLWRVTDLEMGNATQPLSLSKNTIQFIGDMSGINNRYIAHTDSTISRVDTTIHYRYFSTIEPVSDYPQGVLKQDIHNSGDFLSQIFYTDQSYTVYVSDGRQIPQKMEDIPKTTFYVDELVSALEKKNKSISFSDSAITKQSSATSQDDTADRKSVV